MTEPWLPHLKTPEADPTWRAMAACNQHPTSTFFPGQHDRAAERAAIAICATCPVIDPCEQFAEEHHPHGIWAGRKWMTKSGIRLRGPRNTPTT